MDLSPKQIQVFQHKILIWYEANKRDLPWRQTRDPYRILVSEVMSQQTQLSRVVPKYEAWLERFPTVQDLAQAPVSDVLRYWSGLGYNRRALNLQKAAQLLVKNYSSSERSESRSSIPSVLASPSGGRRRQARTINWPKTVEELIKLPGLGKYTASAVACFAFNEQIPVVDTNIRKVIVHEFYEGILPNEKVIEAVAFQILPEGKAYAWNQALMDYSALAMKEKKIPVKKQSHFLSSNRYYRGQTIKLLLAVHTISITGLWDFFAERNPIERERLDEIIRQMVQDGLIVMLDGTISLPEV